MDNRESLMLEASETLLLGILDEKGYPIIYPMEKVTSVGMEKVIFITKLQSDKVKAIKKYSKCSIEIHEEDEILWLFGKTEIVTDFEKIKELLPPNYWVRLTSHENYRDYCVLLFQRYKVIKYKNGKKYEVEI